MEKGSYPQGPPPAYYPSAAPPPTGFMPQHGAYPQQPMTSPPTVVTVIQAPALGPESNRMVCPHCRADISTRVTYQTSCMTHVAAALLCLFGFWCCACVPYCCDQCMDAEHECPNCHKFIGVYRR